MSSSLVYTLIDNQAVYLPEHQTMLTAGVWEQLVQSLNSESSIASVSAEGLYQRYRAGYSGIMLDTTGMIIAHLSLIPSRLNTLLSAYTGVSVPLPDIWKSLTGWTHPDWRNKGISSYLRQKMYAQFTDSLLIGTTFGMGASQQLLSQGWSVASWDQFPYISSLDCWCQPNRIYKVGIGWLHIAGKSPYLSNQIDKTRHQWDRYFHFWVSDPSKSLVLEREIRQLAGDDLHHWRTRIEDHAQTEKS